ncbi:hypothetical protein KCU98_g3466, partial [Aureobasidium melanogenum]
MYENNSVGMATAVPALPSTALEHLHSGSPDVAKQTLKLMARGTPHVRLIPPSAFHSDLDMKSVMKLRKLLVRDATIAVIPECVRDFSSVRSPAIYAETPESAYLGDLHDATCAHGDELWFDVEDLQKTAQACLSKLKDKNAWCQVVNDVLAVSMRLDLKETSFEINNIQSQSIDARFLPSIPIDTRVEKIDSRSDIAIAMSEQNDGRDMLLSPMSDAYTSTMCLPCAIEVERHGGSAEEAELRLMIWQASALSHLQYLHNFCGDQALPVPPVVGWTVVGHTWSFYIAWKDDRLGNVTTMGPFSPGNAGTSDAVSIFVLLSIWKKLFRWLECEYYPAYCKLLQGGIDSFEQGERKPGCSYYDE